MNSYALIGFLWVAAILLGAAILIRISQRERIRERYERSSFIGISD